MRSIVHISDIHFGQADPVVVERLIEKIVELSPDLVVVSGDLTQRARRTQFVAARAFLDRLPEPQIVVPGNHDVPLYNVFDRFFNPLTKFRKYITSDLTPEFFDEDSAVLGINTARSLTIKGGRINQEQVDHVLGRLRSLTSQKVKIIVTHHPFDLPEGFDEDDIVDFAQLAVAGGSIPAPDHQHPTPVPGVSTKLRRQHAVAMIAREIAARAG